MGLQTSILADAARDADDHGHSLIGYRYIDDQEHVPWSIRVRELRAYQRRFGHLQVPLTYHEQGGLGPWVAMTRQRHLLLRPERRAVLNEMGFVWRVREDEDEAEASRSDDNDVEYLDDDDDDDDDEVPFAARLRQLARYQKRFGTLNVPRSYVFQNFLGEYVYTLRRRYRGADPECLPKDQVAALNDLGFVWRQAKVRRRVTGVKDGDHQSEDDDSGRGRARHGPGPIHRLALPRVLDDSWEEGRPTKRRRRHLLEEDTKEPHVARQGRRRRKPIPWPERLRQLEIYKERYGDLNVPSNYEEQGHLGGFVVELRQRHKGNRSSGIPLDRVAQLDALGFSWSRYKNRRGRRQGALVTPVKSADDDNDIDDDGAALGKTPRLKAEDQDDVHAEDHVDFEYQRGQRVPWEVRLQELKIYKAKYGDLRVPFFYQEQGKLGFYVSDLRKRYRGKVKPGLTQQQIDELDELGFVWSGRSGANVAGAATDESGAESDRVADSDPRSAGSHNRGRGRPRKEESLETEPPRRGRGRPRKEEAARRGRGRPRKEESAEATRRGEQNKVESVEQVEPPRLVRGRPRKSDTAVEPAVESRAKLLRSDQPDPGDSGEALLVESYDENIRKGQRTWEQRMDDLRAYKAKYGNLHVSALSQEFHRIGSFVTIVRQMKRGTQQGNRKLSDSQIAELDAMGFPWDATALRSRLRWEKRLNELKAYKAEHGDLRVPKDYEEHRNLGSFILRLRRRRYSDRTGEATLTPQQVADLDDIGFDWEE